MFKEIPVVLSADKILDRSFKKAQKKKIQDSSQFYMKKKTMIAQTESFSTNVVNILDTYVRGFPSIEKLPMFYQDLLNIKIDLDKLRKSLGGIQWAKKTCEMIHFAQIKSLKKSRQITFLIKKQNEIYGRISSVVKQVDDELQIVANAQNLMRSFPDIQDMPTVVLAGYPNVGKSSLLRCLSRAKPKIAQYPFTTKEIHVGHLSVKEKHITKTFQIIDTPGLLDREMNERNEIEQLAISALTHLADVIVFLLDPSETSGYSIQDQYNLLEKIKNLFPDISFICVESKCDLKINDDKLMHISCKNNEGINELKYLLFEKYY
jgi:nucleolar GTP-binding protein